MFRAAAFLAVAMSAVISTASAAAVVTLTESNFDSFVNGEDFTIVEFYAPWCGHCKRLEVPYEEAAQDLASNNPPIKLAKVDATVERALGDRFGVRGYPTIKVFRSGEPSDYDGPRDAAGIAAYARKNSGPAAREFDSVDAAAEVARESTQALVVGAFPSADDAAAKGFLSSASKLRERHSFAVVYGASEPSVVLHRAGLFVSKKDDDATVPFDGASSGSWDHAAFVRFARGAVLPLVSERTRDNQHLFEGHSVPVVTLYGKIDYGLDRKGSNYLANRLRRVARENKGKLLFCVASAASFAGELRELGLESRDVAVAARGTAGEKFVMDGEWSVDAAKDFAGRLVRGEVEQYLKSEPVPASNDGPVTVAVGKNFDEIVNDESKDVFIEFYAPWCGHCKSFADKYETVGSSFSDDDGVSVVKIDATANDYSSKYAVRGYPTFYWAPANNKNSPVKYEGARNADDMIKWIKERRTTTADDKSEL